MIPDGTGVGNRFRDTDREPQLPAAQPPVLTTHPACAAVAQAAALPSRSRIARAPYPTQPAPDLPAVHARLGRVLTGFRRGPRGVAPANFAAALQAGKK